MLLRVGVVSYDRSRKILFLGSVRSHRFLVATEEKSTADGERAARFEKVRGGDIVNFQDEISSSRVNFSYRIFLKNRDFWKLSKITKMC